MDRKSIQRVNAGNFTLTNTSNLTNGRS